MPAITVPTPPPPSVDSTPLGAATTPAEAINVLLDQLLASPHKSKMDTALVRALGEPLEALRTAGLKAGMRMVQVAGEAKADVLLAIFDGILDNPPADAQRAERVTGGILEIAGELGFALTEGDLGGLLSRQLPLLGHESPGIATGAARGMASALRGALRAGNATLGGEVASLLTTHLDKVKTAKTPQECREGAYGVGACIGAAGAPSLERLGVLATLVELLGASPSKTAPYAKEAATLAIEQLSCQLGPHLRADKRVADAAALGVRAMLSQLSENAIGKVLPALYDGMAAVQWRTKVECLGALATLAEHAPSAVGPRLPQAIPEVMECIANTNAKVVEAASEALPLLLQCVTNPETLKLKPFLIEAFLRPETTLECVDELLCTTFVNAMDGTSLAFIMPLLLRALNDARYELVQKAAVASGNMCGLVQSSSEVAPWVPLFEPVLRKCLEHSSPRVREAAERAIKKLIEEAPEESADLGARPTAIAAELMPKLTALLPELPAAVVAFAADSAAEYLERALGGAVKVEYFAQAPRQLEALLLPMLAPYSATAAAPLSAAALTTLCEATVGAFRLRLSEKASAMLQSADGKDYAVDVQSAILAFAGRVLLKGCDLRFERGHRYGLIGQNGVGKTTLLNRLAAKDITGFPQEIKTHYIRHEVVCAEGVTTREHMKAQAPDVDDATVIRTLETVGFPEALQVTPVTSLSGGWKMKLSIAISILKQPELLLLDEPTNHLDVNAVKWLTKHLLSLTNVTICVVSHDYEFIDDVATDVAHYDNGGIAGKPCRLVYYPMGFKSFQQLKPEIAAGLPTADNAMAKMALLAEGGSDAASDLADGMGDVSLDDSEGGSEAGGEGTILSKVDEMMASGQILPIRFPDPGKPEGIRTYRKPILTMKEICYKYPGTDKWILQDATVTVTLGSRAVLLGANGAGKSTFLKLIVGDLEMMEDDGSPDLLPPKGEAWKHHNLRVSYIAQHSLHHLEDSLDQTPMAYIQERFRHGLDREISKLKGHALTDEEKEEMKEIGQVAAIVGRQMRGKALWYEIEKTGRKKMDTQWVPLEELENPRGLFRAYTKKLIVDFDEKQKALDSGMAIRPITSTEILAHLDDFGIHSELAHGKVKQMSGGQRQRLVICAAFWSKPHLIALDEPTNYLDNDTLAALTQALKNFKGAVITVSHNQAFVAEIANEKWIVEDGKITCVQLRDAKAR
ncbi:hypothetical protein Ctob_006459 [Chrysochromulina tobinii]|uniref:ABC transporter domain-containing protein n=1 Tax=Chrysochromulina tobinii TaxID=1460289 RepID=A0A0M0KA25_9EUKA|nr:hypothetical protein Ctob_006459 [Chrysochromulina tobinii]|eukprot:KOO35268.1 hypothetical protein Ctob_006459 [Chrysochromulina sp. CCMP291]